MVIVDLLVRQASLIAETGDVAGLETVAAEHRSLEIEGRHYSRFGDALVPILRDLLGPRVPREVPSAWCDTFWAVIRATEPRAALVDA